jgi:ATP-dependent RNA helicase DHX8/PRP22
MDDLQQLEYLQLVSKITNEFENHFNLNDKTLAEFVIDLCWKSKDLIEFNTNLEQIDAQFPKNFVENIYRLIKTLMPNKPKKKKKKKKEQEKVQFPGLSVKDDASYIEKLMQDEMRDKENQESPRVTRNPRKTENSVENGSTERSRKNSSPYRRSRDRSPAMDKEPIPMKIYSGKVTGIKDFGVFVLLDGIRGKTQGMVHISALLNMRVSHPSDVVEIGQKVHVKVLSVKGSRIGLSMKEVNQNTGEDLSPPDINPSIPSDNLIAVSTDEFKKPAKRKRLTSPERFEIKQLIASGVLNPKDYPDIDEENGFLHYEDKEEELDIEVREEEPNFLVGQTKQSLQLSPIKIVKNPDGSMNRAALAGATLAKERRDLRQLKNIEKTQQDSAEADANSSAPGEWRKKIFNSETKFGRATSMSMREQRESLPIFKLRETIIQAVEDNQILVVVGETGSGKVNFS